MQSAKRKTIAQNLKFNYVLLYIESYVLYPVYYDITKMKN